MPSGLQQQVKLRQIYIELGVKTMMQIRELVLYGYNGKSGVICLLRWAE